MRYNSEVGQLSLYFLGPPRIERDGQLVEVDTRKAMALLGYLALTGDTHPRDALAAFLWPEFDDSRAKAALRRTLSTLRAALGGDHFHVTRTTIGLRKAAGDRCDVVQFIHHMSACRAHDHPAILSCDECLARLETAVALYRDDFLAGFSLRDSLPFDDWQLLQAERLRRELSLALEKLARMYSRRGQYEPALAYAHRWLSLDPLREETHRLLMELYAGSGRRNAALQQYRECVRVLDAELGVSPLEETTALYQAIQNSQWQPPADPEPGNRPLAPRLITTGGALPLVGRERALAQMQQLYRQVGPDGRLLCLSGEAGIGKTRLAEQFLAAARAEGAVVLSSRCYQGEMNLTFDLFSQALRESLADNSFNERWAAVPGHWRMEAARLVPELVAQYPDLTPPPPLDSPGGQSRFFEGVVQVLHSLAMGPVPGILFVDDLHWADAASLELLIYLMRRLQKRPLLILATWREEATEASSQLLSLTVEAQRRGVGQVIALSRLTQSEVAALVKGAGLTWTAEIQEQLYRETEGLPYFVAEYLVALNPSPADDPADLPWSTPHTVRDLLLSRLANVSEMGRQLLQAAAAAGRPADYELLQLASGRTEEETILALEELTGQKLLFEATAETPFVEGIQPFPALGPTHGSIHGSMNGPIYHFSHNKLQALVYEETSLVRRRLLHRRLAEALMKQARRQGQPEPLGQIAAHYRMAGQEAQAANYYRRAGDHAAALFANHEALAHYQTALALGHTDAAVLQEACGDLHRRLGEYQAAISSYETAAAMSPEEDLGRLEHKLGQVYQRRGAWALAERQFEAARENLGDTPSVPLAQLYIDWGHVAYRQGQPDRSQALAQQALALAKAAADPLVLAQAHNILGILARHRGELVAALGHLVESCELAVTADHPEARVAALNNLALVENAMGSGDRAEALLFEALTLCVRYGDRHQQAALHNNLADLLHRQGQKAAAMDHLKQAVSIYAEVGRDGDEWQPEIWKLTEW